MNLPPHGEINRMDGERNLGVTEAGLGLTFVICLLLVLGYMILHHLGSTREAPMVEVRPGFAAEQAAAPEAASRADDDEPPQVLTIESNDVSGQALRNSVDSDSELR